MYVYNYICIGLVGPLIDHGLSKFEDNIVQYVCIHNYIRIIIITDVIEDATRILLRSIGL